MVVIETDSLGKDRYFLAQYLVMAARIVSGSPQVYRSTLLLYIMGVKDTVQTLTEPLRVEVYSVVLTAVACSNPSDIGKPDQYSKILDLHQCWSPASMALALANPVLNSQEALCVKSFFARRAPKSFHLDKILQDACGMLLRNADSVSVSNTF